MVYSCHKLEQSCDANVSHSASSLGCPVLTGSRNAVLLSVAYYINLDCIAENKVKYFCGKSLKLEDGASSPIPPASVPPSHFGMGWRGPFGGPAGSCSYGMLSIESKLLTPLSVNFCC